MSEEEKQKQEALNEQSRFNEAQLQIVRLNQFYVEAYRGKARNNPLMMRKSLENVWIELYPDLIRRSDFAQQKKRLDEIDQRYNQAVHEAWTLQNKSTIVFGKKVFFRDHLRADQPNFNSTIATELQRLPEYQEWIHNRGFRPSPERCIKVLEEKMMFLKELQNLIGKGSVYKEDSSRMF